MEKIMVGGTRFLCCTALSVLSHMRKVLLTVLMLLLTAASVSHAVVNTAGWPPWGTLIATVDGVHVYSNGGYVNNTVSSTYGYLYQCVELAQRYFAQRWQYQNVWPVATARQMMDNAPQRDRYGNAKPIYQRRNGYSWNLPQRGDALVFDSATDGSNAAGHVAIVTDVSGGYVYFAEQNFSKWGQYPVQISSTSTGYYITPRGAYPILGWLHSQANNGNINPPAKFFTEVSVSGISNVGSDNNAPKHPQRTLSANVLNMNGQIVSSPNGTVNYNSNKGVFAGGSSLGYSWTSGYYQVKAWMPYTLRKLIPEGFWQTYHVLAKGVDSYLYVGMKSGSLNLPGLQLVSGDLNANNQLNILDYNIFLSCYGKDPVANPSCAPSDLDDNGRIEGIDYNIYVRNSQTQRGD